MSLQQWANNGWLKVLPTSKREIGDLLGIVHRDLADASQKGISTDARFGLAYNAALKLCTILLRAEGYLPANDSAHYRTLQTLSLILGDQHKANVDYLEGCRTKRKTLVYSYVGGTTDGDVKELCDFVKELETIVIGQLKASHPNLVP